MQNPVKLTRVMADPYGDLLPHAYIVYKQSQLCRCGHLHSWTQMMTETHIKSTLQQGKYSTIHRRVEDIKYNLPVVRVIEAQTEKVMFCHECFSTTSLAHLPSPPIPETKIVGGIQATAQPKKPAKARETTTLDDLLI